MVPPADTPAGQMFLNQVPLGRYAEAEEIAALVEYIASPDAAVIAGSKLDINGAYDLMGKPHLFKRESGLLHDTI